MGQESCGDWNQAWQPDGEALKGVRAEWWYICSKGRGEHFSFSLYVARVVSTPVDTIEAAAFSGPEC